MVVQTVKHLPTMWETRVQSLDQEDLLEKGMATHSSILACERSLVGCSSRSCKSQTWLSEETITILTYNMMSLFTPLLILASL